MSDAPPHEPASPASARGRGEPSLSARLVRFIGRRTVAWLAIAVCAAFTLATVELSVSVFLQLFLKSLGLLSVEVHVPMFHVVPTPAALGVGLIGIALVRSICQFLVAQSSTITMETMNARVRRISVWEMLLHPSSRIVPAGAVNARIGDLAVKSSLFCYAGAAMTGYVVQAAALTVAMFLTARGETVIALSGLALVGLVVLRINRTTREVATRVPAELRILTEGIERIARNMSLVRVLRTQVIEHRRLASAVDRYARYLVHAGVLGNLAMAVTPFAGVVLILVIVVASQRYLETPGLTLLSFLYLFVRFVQTLSTLTTQFSTCSACWPMFEDCLDYVSQFTDVELEAAMRVDADLLGRAVEKVLSTGGSPPAIDVREVSFAYPRARAGDVLRHINIHIEKGSQFAIVGPSGSGKSTLLSLVLGLLRPSDGTISIDGRAPTAFFADPSVRVGYVGAEAFLIAGTIRENLRYGISVEATDEDLLEALAQARVSDAVLGLPGGLDYEIAEDGSGLSAGQKQRLCLARGLLNRPHVLVLDEASANLDAVTEGEIAESLKTIRGKCTTLIVSHRMGLLKYADQSVTLAQVEQP